MPPIIVNRFGLPEPIVKAAQHNEHQVLPGAISVTQLILPPRIRVLRERHDYEMDVSEMTWMLFGSALHKILESDDDSEVFLSADFGIHGDNHLLCGTVDRIKDGVLSDYKCTSVWSLILGEKPEWEAQLNLYAELCRRNSMSLQRLQIVALLRDWSASKAQHTADYPPCPIMTVPIAMWDGDTCRRYIRDRFALHRRAEQLPDEELPMCTSEERWKKPPVFAVMKRGNKTASKNCNTREEAIQYIVAHPGNSYSIEERPGTSPRCEGNYCGVASICEGLRDA